MGKGGKGGGGREGEGAASQGGDQEEKRGGLVSKRERKLFWYKTRGEKQPPIGHKKRASCHIWTVGQQLEEKTGMSGPSLATNGAGMGTGL